MIPPNIKSLILDMDGVLWKDSNPIGDLPAIFARIRLRGLKVVFATNNGTRTPEQYIERLAGFGVQAETWQVVTSSLVVAELLARRFSLPLPLTSRPPSAPNACPACASAAGTGEQSRRVGRERGVGREGEGVKIFAIGEEGVMKALRDKGFEPLPVEEAEKAQAVVMGIDRQINYNKMREAALLVRRGLPFYATNPDKTFPTPRGEIPGAGAWVSVIVTATGVEPIYAGKPAPYLLELARERLGTAKEETLVVGDRLETDIAGGQAAGCPVALVFSGVSTRKEGKAWKPGIDVMAEDLGELIG
jgi:4-nitrophenyl phosphatase